MTTTIEILKAARDLIAKPENWTQGHYAVDKFGDPTYIGSERSVCFCSIGALATAGKFHISHEIPAEILSALGMDESEIIRFNDEHSHAEVLDLFSKAISSAEEKQGAAS